MKITKKRRKGLKVTTFITILLFLVVMVIYKIGMSEATGNSSYVKTENKSLTADIKLPTDNKPETTSENDELLKHNTTVKQPTTDNNQQTPVVQTPEQNKSAVESTNNTEVNTAVKDNSKVVYLTFDDGPSKTVTPTILEVLKKENVKATFFVVGQTLKNNPQLLQQEKDEGHSIGNHTYSHNYNYLYSNINNFLDDLKKNDSLIKSIIGDYNEHLIRFPAGSFGRQAYIEAAEKAGYKYVDWNCLDGDAEGKPRTPDQLLQRVKGTMKGQNNLTILMHDAADKEATAQALPKIIEYLKAQGYKFMTY